MNSTEAPHVQSKPTSSAKNHRKSEYATKVNYGSEVNDTPAANNNPGRSGNVRPDEPSVKVSSLRF